MVSERDEVRRAYELVRQAVQDADVLMRRAASSILRAFEASGIGTGPVTTSMRRGIMRAIDPVLWVFYGRTRRQASSSEVYQLIERRATITAVDRVRRAWDELDSTMRRTDPALWTRLQGYLAAADPFERDRLVQTYHLLYGPHVEQERLRRSLFLDPLRRWVDPRGYRLSDRVWLQGRDVRRGIDDRIRQGIRRGESAESIARSLRHYLDPDFAEVRFQQNGRIIRTATNRGNRSAVSAARRLARTEISRVNAEAARVAAEGVPGIKGLRFRLSGSHPAQDSCNPLAEQDLYGLGRGVYPPDRFPTIPVHPNCLCLCLPVHKSRDEVRADLVTKYRTIALGELA